MIKLTLTEHADKAFWMNPDHVVTIMAASDGTTFVCVVNETQPFHVKEPAEGIALMVSARKSR